MHTDPPPDYAHYSDADLEDALKHVNRDKYPERFAALQAEMQRRAAARPQPAPGQPRIGLPRRPLAPLAIVVLLVMAAYFIVIGVMGIGAGISVLLGARGDWAWWLFAVVGLGHLICGAVLLWPVLKQWRWRNQEPR